jgi:hypothetical protein
MRMDTESGPPGFFLVSDRGQPMRRTSRFAYRPIVELACTDVLIVLLLTVAGQWPFKDTVALPISLGTVLCQNLQS